MLKKSLGVIAGGLLIAGMANATELYNQNGTTFSFGGYVSLGYQSTKADNKYGSVDGKFDSIDGKVNESRINFGGTRQINENLKGFGFVELGINPSETNDSEYFHNRLGYVGLEHTKLGKITFGKQWGSFYDVAGFTDVYELTGGDAAGTYNTPESGDFIGLARATASLKYEKKFGPVALSLQYQAKDSTSIFSQTYADSNQGGQLVTNDYLLNKKYSFGAALVTDIGSHIKVGIAGNHAKFGGIDGTDGTNLLNNKEFEVNSAIIGVSYNSDLIVAGLTTAYHTTLYSISSPTIGQESFLGIKVMKPVLVYVGNNYQRTSYKSFDDQLPHGDIRNSVDYNYAVVGLKYSFSDSLTTAIEYRQDLRTNHDIENSIATGHNSNANNIATYIRYYF